MELIKFEDYLNLDIKPKLVAAIGEFDGIHLAHQKLIEKTIYIAQTQNYKSAIICFEPHPLKVLKPELHIGNITTLDEKNKILSKYNLDYLIVIKFDLEFAKKSPLTFVNDYLLSINVCNVVVGFDFKFGADSIGKATDIKKLSNNKIDVTIIDEIKYNDEKVGSSNIRRLLEEGEIEKANTLLGHPFSIDGIVEHGDGIGKDLDLPTANIAYKNDSLILKNGVYAVKVTLDEITYIGMLNIGHNPTFNYQNNLRYEINILGYTGNLYSKYMVIEIYKYIRCELKFNSVEDFKAQIQNDKVNIENYFKNM